MLILVIVEKKVDANPCRYMYSAIEVLTAIYSVLGVTSIVINLVSDYHRLLIHFEHKKIKRALAHSAFV
jgi:hypothetical protein